MLFIAETQNTPRARTVTPAPITPFSIRCYPLQVPSSQAAQAIPKAVKKLKPQKSIEDEEDEDWLPTKRVTQPSLSMVKVEASKMKKSKIKNNNLEWHSLKKVLECQICDRPPGLSLISHYVNFHPNSEVLNSRLSPDIAEMLRFAVHLNKCETVRSGPATTYKQMCYFCNVYKTLTRLAWTCHMARHTGYYQYKCEECSRQFAEAPVNHVCKPNSVKKFVPPVFQQEIVTAYVCDLCNYVRFYEHEIQMHLNNEHETGDAKEFKAFTFFYLPKGKRGRRRQSFNIQEEFKSEFEEGQDDELAERLRNAIPVDLDGEC